jgi:glycosyltransferase involved in cell wall biosynthesis
LRKQHTIHWIEVELKGNLASANPAIRRNFELYKCKLDRYFAITEYVAQTSLRDYGLISEKIIPVGVDTGIFKAKHTYGSERIKVLFVGHLVERKHPDFVVEAAKHHPNVEFIIVGENRDGYQQHLEQLICNYRLTNVTIQSAMPQRELATFIQSCDLLLHPSRVEGLPKVTLEAAACGLPCIVFNDYQTPSVMEGITGYQVATFEEMLARLAVLIRDADLRRQMGQAAESHARNFDWDSIAKQWEAVFESSHHAHS